VFEVTSANDRKLLKGEGPESGTIRWAVEGALRAHGGIVCFHETLRRAEIRLNRPLVLGDNTTLDGRKTGITLLSSGGTLLQIATRNVIVRGMTFKKDAYVDGEGRQGDGISVFGSFDNVLIENNTFERCGDGCIDIVRRSPIQSVGRATISHNKFLKHNKVMLIGLLDPEKEDAGSRILAPEILVTLYRNHFSETSQRQPKVVSGAYVDVINNLFDLRSLPMKDGRRTALYGALAANGGIINVEHNVFEVIDQGHSRAFLAAGTVADLKPGGLHDGSVARLEGNYVGPGLRLGQTVGSLPDNLRLEYPPSLRLTRENLADFKREVAEEAGAED
jgi:pectate lyase